MTAAEIEAIEARAKAEWSRDADGEFISETWSADFVGPTIMALVAEVRRLRGLVGDAQWHGALEGEPYTGCPWCGVESEYLPSNQKPHAATCPAFTPDGEVR